MIQKKKKLRNQMEKQTNKQPPQTSKHSQSVSILQLHAVITIVKISWMSMSKRFKNIQTSLMYIFVRKKYAF